MKKSKAVSTEGIIDDEVGLIKGFEDLTVDESRAVLSTHMLCYVLDGSIGISELALWKKLLVRVEELYQTELAKFDTYSAQELRDFIVLYCPRLKTAVSRVPIAVGATHAKASFSEGMEKSELLDIASCVPRPKDATKFDHLIPRVICQRFRDNIPVSAQMIFACYDPDANKEFKANTLTPEQLSKFTFNETVYRVISILTAQV
eukprot:SAG31_NODE_11822_length_995_cov_1.097098_1_plen_204_part_00